MSDVLPIQLDEMSRTPIYDQIEEQLKSLIISGTLPREQCCHRFES